MEPLGQTQVLGYLLQLSKEFSITLITYEKASDYANNEAKNILKSKCIAHGIIWLPRRYHRKPRMLATSWDLLMLLWDTWRLTRLSKAQLVHCRSYIPAIAAWIVGIFTKIPFIFDMRALWPEEMVASGGLKRNSYIYKALNWLEHRLLRKSTVIVSLTDAAVTYLKHKYPETETKIYVVIPTCADLTRFNVTSSKSDQLVIGSMGTVLSGWYHLDCLFKLYRQATYIKKNIKLKIVTRDDLNIINKIANSNYVDSSTIDFDRAEPENIYEKISDMSFGVLFFTTGVSKLGSAPTRMAEFLACGIPIMGNRGVGDMASIIERHKVGIVIEDLNEETLLQGLNAMINLLSDPDISQRCRSVAEQYFSIETGSEKYKKIYYQIINRSD